MPWTKEDRSFKTLINRRETDSTGKQFYNEYGDFTINTHAIEIWSDEINASPAQAIIDGRVELKTLFTLTWDNSVPNYQCYYSFESGNRLKDWVSTKYGNNYEIHLFDNSNNEIYPTDACQWFFDYQTGILTFNGITTGFTRPFKITGYRYIGAKGVSNVSFTAKTTKLTINDFIFSGGFFDVTESGTNYSMSGDVSFLGGSEAFFNQSRDIQIFLNGLKQIKGEDVVWNSSTTFVLNQIVDNTDEIIVMT